MFRPALLFIFAALLIILGRVPAVIAPPWDIDEGLYAAVGQALGRGDLLYQDIWDNKPPGIYFFFDWLGKLSQDYAVIRLAASLILVATAGVVFYLSKRILTPAKAYWALAIFSFLAIVPIFETNVTNSELLLILPTSLAIFLTILVEAGSLRRRYLILVGLLIAVAFLFKTVAIFDGLAIVTYLYLRRGKLILPDLGLVLAGAGTVALLLLGYLSQHNLWGDFIRATLLNNFGYIGQGSLAEVSFIAIDNPLITVGGKILALAAGVLLIKREYPRMPPVALIYLWLAFTLFGAFLSGRPFLHYLISALPAAVIVIPDFMAEAILAWKSRGVEARSFVKGVLLAGGLSAALVLGFAGKIEIISSSPEASRVVRGYYANAFGYLSGRISQSEYFDFYGETVNLNLKLRDWLVINSSVSDRVYIWGNAPWVYYLSSRRPATKYLAAYQHTFVKEARGEVTAELTADPPRFIIVTNEPDDISAVKVPTPEFAELDDLLAAEYHLAAKVLRADIYERNYLADAGTP